MVDLDRILTPEAVKEICGLINEYAILHNYCLTTNVVECCVTCDPFRVILTFVVDSEETVYAVFANFVGQIFTFTIQSERNGWTDYPGEFEFDWSFGSVEELRECLRSSEITNSVFAALSGHRVCWPSAEVIFDAFVERQALYRE